MYKSMNTAIEQFTNIVWNTKDNNDLFLKQISSMFGSVYGRAWKNKGSENCKKFW